MKVIEFDVRQIDAHGDAFDVDSYRTKRQALQFANHIVATMEGSQCVAVVVERHTFNVDADGIIRGKFAYDKILTIGSESALRAGCWID